VGRHCGGRAFEVHPRERWVSLCRCGSFHAFFPDAPDWRPEDPLAAALAEPGLLDEPTPPWLRVFQLSSGFPWWLRWRHLPDECNACSQHVTFAVWTHVRPGVQAHSTLCLQCGFSTVEHVHYGRDAHETPVAGDQWSPPCVAVARLRRAVFGALPFWQRGHFFANGIGEDDDA
jgi:hypothetical protein